MTAKARCVLVVAAEESSPLALKSAVAITTKWHGSQYEVTLPRVPFLREQRYVNAQSIQPFKLVELGRMVGKFEPAVMGQVRHALKN